MPSCSRMSCGPSNRTSVARRGAAILPWPSESAAPPPASVRSPVPALIRTARIGQRLPAIRRSELDRTEGPDHGRDARLQRFLVRAAAASMIEHAGETGGHGADEPVPLAPARGLLRAASSSRRRAPGDSASAGGFVRRPGRLDQRGDHVRIGLMSFRFLFHGSYPGLPPSVPISSSDAFARSAIATRNASRALCSCDSAAFAPRPRRAAISATDCPSRYFHSSTSP